jgi:hypothetical protein
MESSITTFIQYLWRRKDSHFVGIVYNIPQSLEIQVMKLLEEERW